MVGLERSRLFSMGFFVMLSGIMNNIFSTYVYCAFAENVTQNLAATGDIFYEYLWYQLPLEQRLAFVVPIQRAQREFHFTGFDLVNCSLEVFTTVKSLNVFFLNILLSGLLIF